MTDSIDGDASGGGGMLEAARREKLKKIKELGVDPWGGRFDDHEAIGQIRAREGEIEIEPQGDCATGQPPEQHGPKVRAAGRIVLSRKKGKLIFIDIRDWTGQIQLFVGRNQVGEEAWELAQCFDLGDLIGVDGELKKTKTGELTIFAEKLHFLTKSIEPPPAKHKGLRDPELRQRMRYLDLIHTEGALERALRRTKIVQSVRNTLASQGFVEVEGPTLHAIAGGAAARPFTTHHNALDIDLFMRIALELHLKRLLVGGIERVYELGRVYRNEGISPRHNPEFTMLEVYQAYGNYETMMDLTEAVIVDAIRAMESGPLSLRERARVMAGGETNSAEAAKTTSDSDSPHPRPLSQRERGDVGMTLPWGDAEIDFTPPFARKTYDELFVEHTGIRADDTAGIARLAEQIGFSTAGKHPDVVKSFVFEERVEGALTGPIFVLDYPASICPLTKRKATNPAVAERFELFIQGMEVANAYTELNDPDLQEELFASQLAGLPEEESMAKMDRDFVRALRHGMPPAGGLGIGIDRLVMLLTNSQTIREVILFPLLRPEKEGDV
ncbi:MAG: lysine--tRNA ligase [Pirellulales bacterium]|nr:lysine--tRNA ligase [Pirellulales bacterium]